MSPETEDIMNQALRLPREARALLAEKLLESLDSEEPFELSREWKEEIARRCRELDEGTMELIPGEDVLKEATGAVGWALAHADPRTADADHRKKQHGLKPILHPTC